MAVEYRWSGWIGICDEHCIVRSMPRRESTPDNSRAEGFFGRLKVEFFYGRGWNDASMGEFIEMLDAYLVWQEHGPGFPLYSPIFVHEVYRELHGGE